MQKEEIIANYKRRKPTHRLGAAIGIGLLLPALWGWVNTDIGEIEARKSQAVSEKDSSEIHLNRLIAQKKNAPRLEEQLKFTESELVEARKRLPSEYFIDLMIQRLGLLANKAKVTLKLFSPGEESIVQGPVQYVEMPIKMEVIGGFNEIAQFYDAIVHFDTMIHIRNVELKSSKASEENKSEKDPSTLAPKEELDVSQKFEMESKSHQVLGSMTLVLFRSMRQDETSVGNAPPGSSQQAGQPANSSSSALAQGIPPPATPPPSAPPSPSPGSTAPAPGVE